MIKFDKETVFISINEFSENLTPLKTGDNKM